MTEATKTTTNARCFIAVYTTKEVPYGFKLLRRETRNRCKRTSFKFNLCRKHFEEAKHCYLEVYGSVP